MTLIRQNLRVPAAWLLLALLFLPVVLRSFTSNRLTWAVTEMLINFRGGFVRRGLLGELILLTGTSTGLSPFLLIGTLFLITTTAIVCAMLWLLRPYIQRFPVVTALVLFSPALLMFPVNEYAAYARKESFVLIGLLLHAIVARRFSSGELSVKQMKRFYLLVLMPLLLLCMFIHEVQLFYLPAHVGMMFLAARHRQVEVRWLLLIFVMPVMTAMVLARFHGNAEMVPLIIESVRPLLTIPPDQAGAIDTLGWSVDRFREVAKVIWMDGSTMVLYGAAWVLSVIVPAAVLGSVVVRHASRPDPALTRWLIVFIGLTCAAPFPLYLLGADFGRWIHLTAFSVVCLLLSIPVAPTQPADRDPRCRFWSGGWAVLLCGIYIFGWELPHFGNEPQVLNSGLAGSLLRSSKLIAQTVRPQRSASKKAPPKEGERSLPQQGVSTTQASK